MANKAEALDSAVERKGGLGSDDEPEFYLTEALAGSNGPLEDLSMLKLVENPDSPRNRGTLPQTLHECVGYLEGFPLIQPNTDKNNPLTISQMVNVLALPSATEELEAAISHNGYTGPDLAPTVYRDRQLQAYDCTSDPMADLCRRAKRHVVHKRSVMGRVVQPGCVRFYKRFGVIYAVPEGLWLLFPDPFASWITKSIPLDQTFINIGTDDTLVIRIIEGQVGLITDQGIHKLLDEGTHVFNSGVVKLVEIRNYADVPHFSHGPYHYINVPRGKYAKIWAEVVTDGVKSLVPRLLKEGEHFIKSSFFEYNGLELVSKDYIGHGSVHVINVEKGFLAKVIQENDPRCLGEGVHVIESSNCIYCGTVAIRDVLAIQHGTISILQVPRGKIALVWQYNNPFFIDRPGLYEFNSADFKFEKFVDSKERQIDLGSKKALQVYTGEVGITYENGELKILESGRHLIESSTHIFERFLSTKQRSIRLMSHDATFKMTKPKQEQTEFKDDLLVCETKDLVRVGVRADVFYSIQDPEKCIRNLDTDQLEDLVRETAVATLTNIIRSTALNQIAQSKNVSASSGPEEILAVSAANEADNTGEDTDRVVSLFFDRAHDEFMSKLHEDFLSRYGVDIANIRMEAFKIMDTELANQISKHVLTTAKVENELANLEGEHLIATQKERTQAEVETINADAEAKSQKTRADAENLRKIDAAKAEAESLRIKTVAKAEAEAAAILTKAKAEAEAIRLKATAEAERAKVISTTNLGQQESLLKIYAEMITESNAGVSKVIYLDPSVNRESPFALGTLDNLNRDLHSLSTLGIAAKEAYPSRK